MSSRLDIVFFLYYHDFMIVLLVFAFISGLVTIFAPCIWPLLPIVLSSTATGGKGKPLGVTLGTLVSFALVTLTVSYIVKIIPFDPNVLRLFAVIIISFLGLVLIIPKLSQILEGYVSRLSGKVAAKTDDQRTDFQGGFITGLALGIVWAPCAGPILATIATLAATRAVSFEVILVTIVYVVGIGIPLFLFALAGNRLFSRSRFLSKYTGRIQQIFGIVMILTALAIFINYDKVLEVKLLDTFPSFSGFINQLEGNPNVQRELRNLKNKKNQLTPTGQSSNVELPNLGPAPEFVGITKWLNTDKPLKMSDLKGKVVLVDFWTYTCINCIRTLPFVTSWYEKYKDKGFVVIGVHTPEFEFEKKTANVENAIKQYAIHYPVAQDNDYKTWTAYNNQYWPAEYLIDADGNIRRTHFGEGEYDQSEMAIKKLLEEAGRKVDSSILNVQDQTPHITLSPETYLGLTRRERYSQDNPPLHYFSYSGKWNVQNEYAESTGDSSLEFNFYADRVFLVITPSDGKDIINVFLDGKPIDPSVAGKDVSSGKVIIDQSRLYNLVDLKGKAGQHLLKLEFKTKGTKVFAFTFG